MNGLTNPSFARIAAFLVGFGLNVMLTGAVIILVVNSKETGLDARLLSLVIMVSVGLAFYCGGVFADSYRSS